MEHEAAAINILFALLGDLRIAVCVLVLTERNPRQRCFYNDTV